MATPSYEELLQGATKWRYEYKDINCQLSHHGYRTGNEYVGAEHHPGTWCYYLLIPEQMFDGVLPWSNFVCKDHDHGPAWEYIEFHSEITWSSSEPYYDRKTDRVWDLAKVGCDYGHSWDRDMGYPDTLEDVKRHAQLTVESFLKAFPNRKIRSDWSGKWDTKENFYEAINGRTIHKEDEILEEYMKYYGPKEEVVNE